MVESLFPLTLRNAEVIRRGKTLIGPISLEIDQNGFTILLGPNGAGKTTLLRLLHGLERLARGKRSWGLPEAEARKAQAFVFQRPVMLRRSVRDNLALARVLQGDQWNQARDHAQMWLDQIGLQGASERPAAGLSGGEKQKLALARALIRRPAILFLDEPCSNLDGRSTREIETILTNAKQDGTRIVMSTHDIGQAKRLADDVLFLNHGRLIEAGPASAFFQSPETTAARQFIRGDIVE